MTLKTGIPKDLHLPHGYLTTSFFRPVCPQATECWLGLLISDEQIEIERDGDMMRLTARCDLPIMRYYAQGEPRSHTNAGHDPLVHHDFDFIAELSRLLAHGSSAEIWCLSPDGQPWEHTVTPARMN